MHGTNSERNTYSIFFLDMTSLLMEGADKMGPIRSEWSYEGRCHDSRFLYLLVVIFVGRPTLITRLLDCDSSE